MPKRRKIFAIWNKGYWSRKIMSELWLFGSRQAHIHKSPFGWRKKLQKQKSVFDGITGNRMTRGKNVPCKGFYVWTSIVYASRALYSSFGFRLFSTLCSTITTNQAQTHSSHKQTKAIRMEEFCYTVCNESWFSFDDRLSSWITIQLWCIQSILFDFFFSGRFSLSVQSNEPNYHCRVR